MADLLTLHEHADFFEPTVTEGAESEGERSDKKNTKQLPDLRPLTVAYVGDSANVLHDMLVTYPRLGHQLRVASPKKYRAPAAVWDRVVELGCDKGIWWGSDPKEAVYGADVVVTDTWFAFLYRHITSLIADPCASSGYLWAKRLRKRKGFVLSKVIR